MTFSSIEPIVAAVKSGEHTARAFIDEALAKAEKERSYNTVIGFINERARQRADAIDARVANGEDVGLLAGVPFLAKDNFLTFGTETTAASNILKDFTAPYQSTAIERLEAAGAICIGKANLDAFGHGTSTENSDFGPAKNPHNAEYVPGGSSGGSAAAVALDIVPFSLGTDTGGSIRLPASYCGVVGMKPTYGLVSRFGVVAMASSTDTIGVLAKSSYDTGLLFDVMVGEDERDGTTIQRDADSYIPKQESKQLFRIGVVKEYMSDGLDDGVRAAIDAQIKQLRKAGHTVETVSLPLVDLALAVYYVVVPAELSSNLARYDGIRYGHHSKDAKSLSEVYANSRSEGFNDENKRRIMIGNYVLSSGYYDAYYRKAQMARTLLIKDFTQAFEKYDVLIGPVAPSTAFKLGENVDDPLKMYLVDIMTVSVSLAGLPALSVPVGQANGLPVGLQIIGAQRADKTILQLAQEIEGLHA